MVENQHRLIDGYRELDADEIERMNEAKRLERDVLAFLERQPDLGADPRWTSIARTQMQVGFMALGRAIARPEGY